MAVKRQLRARKTPSSNYPADPPSVPPTIEVLYHAIHPQKLESSAATFAEHVVTSQTLYRPGILALARLSFEGSRWEVHHEREEVRVVPFPNHGELANWDRNLIEQWESANTRSAPEGVSFHAFDNTFDFSIQRFERLQEEFIQQLISDEILEIIHNPFLKIHQKLNESEESFQERCVEKARADLEKELQTLEDTIQRQHYRLKEKLDREVREASGSDSNSGTLDNNQAEMDAQESLETIEQVRKELAVLEAQRTTKMNEFEERVQTVARERETDILRLNHSNIEVIRFALVWLPYTEFIIQDGEERRQELVQSF